MTATIGDFRATFPEFIDDAIYSDAQVTIWFAVAAQRVSITAWAELYDLGVYLFTAHQLVLGRAAARVAAAGGSPGQVVGPMTAKAVKDVSASYDAAGVQIDGAGNWNASTYGTRFYELLLMMGSGGYQATGLIG